MSINKNQIKKVSVIAILIVALVGAGVLSVRKYNDQVNADRNAAQAETAQKQSEIDEAKAKEARVFEQYTKNRLECEKGQELYARLTAFQRQGLSAPNCGPAVIE